MNDPFDDFMSCKTSDGITVGLIDGMIAIARVLKQRDLTNPGVQEALTDLAQDDDIKDLIQAGSPNKWVEPILTTEEAIGRLIALGYQEPVITNACEAYETYMGKPAPDGLSKLVMALEWWHAGEQRH
jgi:hypothetical protein